MTMTIMMIMIMKTIMMMIMIMKIIMITTTTYFHYISLKNESNKSRLQCVTYNPFVKIHGNITMNDQSIIIDGLLQSSIGCRPRKHPVCHQSGWIGTRLLGQILVASDWAVGCDWENLWRLLITENTYQSFMKWVILNIKYHIYLWMRPAQGTYTCSAPDGNSHTPKSVHVCRAIQS